MDNIALSLNALGRYKEALELVERALRIYRHILGSTHPETMAGDTINRGEVLAAMNDFAGALKSYQEANTIWEQEFAAADPRVAFSLTGIGTALVGLQRSSEAIAPLERALDIRQNHDPDGARLGETEFALARALWDSHREAGRAVMLAQSAMKHYGALPSSTAARTKLAEWLAHRNRASKRAPAVQID